MTKIYLFTFFLLFHCSNLIAQTVGLFTHLKGSEDDGYMLFSPLTNSDTTYLIDKCGKLVHKWASIYNPGADVYLLPDGTLLRSGHYPQPPLRHLQLRHRRHHRAYGLGWEYGMALRHFRYTASAKP